jgi:hypothetical protein
MNEYSKQDRIDDSEAQIEASQFNYAVFVENLDRLCDSAEEAHDQSNSEHPQNLNKCSPVAMAQAVFRHVEDRRRWQKEYQEKPQQPNGLTGI